MNRRFTMLLLCLLCICPSLTCADDKSSADRYVEERLGKFNELLEAGRGNEALQALQQVQERYPDHPTVLAYEGRVHLMRNNAQGAMTSLNAALQKQPNHPIASALMASIEFRTGKGAEAVARLEAATKVHPDSPELLQIAAEIKMAQMDGAGALPLWRKIADNDKNPAGFRANALAQIGAIHAHQKHHAEAADALGKAIELRWHPNVAFAHLQQLAEAGQVEAGLKAVIDFRGRMNAPQLAQIRQQAMAQLEPLEADLRLREIGQILESDNVNYTAVRFKIDSVNRTITNSANPAVKALKTRLAEHELDAEMFLLKDGIAKKYTSSWIKGVADKIETLAKDMQGPKVDAALAATKEARENAVAGESAMIAAALELAESGWILKNFNVPTTEQKKALEEKNLPEFRSMPFAVKDALRKHYEQFTVDRKPAPFEEHVRPFLESPGDAATQARLAASFSEHVKNVDITVPDFSRQTVVADRIWAQPGRKFSSPDLSDALDKKREESYSLWDSFQAGDLWKARDWQTLIDGYTRAIAVYPRQGPLINRAKAHLFAGNVKQAYLDMAASVAVVAWERAHTYVHSDAMGGTWDVDGIPAVQVLQAIVDGRRTTEGPFPSAPLMDALDHMKHKRWIELARYVAHEHHDKSIDRMISSDIKHIYQIYKAEMLDAVAAAMKGTTDAAAREDLIKVAKAVGSYGHPDFQLVEAAAETDLQKRESHLLAAFNTYWTGNGRHYGVNMALADHYEKQGKTNEAMMHYNIAAGGGIAANLTGDARTAAAARDRLEKVTGLDALWTVYEPLYNANSTAIKERKHPVLAAARQDALLTRLLLMRGNPAVLLGGRADARRAIHDFAGANADLMELAKLKPESAAHYHAVIGLNFKESGHPDKAMEYYGKAIDGGYKRDWVFFNRAKLHQSAGRNKEALDDYSAAIEVNPDSIAALTARSELYEYRFKKDAEGLADAKKAKELILKANPNADTFVLNLRISGMELRVLQRQIDGR